MIHHSLSLAKTFFRVLYAFGLSRAGLNYALGRFFELRDNHGAAEQQFTRLSNKRSANQHSRIRRVFNYAQASDFHLARCQYNLGQDAPDDPLFRCALEPVSDPSGRRGAGRFDANFSHLGLRLDGFVSPGLTKGLHLKLFLDDQLIRTIPLSRKRFIPPYFHYHLKREVLARFPVSGTLSLYTEEGQPLDNRGGSALHITIPHGDGTLAGYLEAGGAIDKKGFLALTPDTIRARQARYLAIYSEARQYFREQFQSPLFLMYGTLLGFVREGDFIPGDDDFDAGYISHKNSAAEVKVETMQLVVDLVLAGFTCSFNRNGRLFRLRLKDDVPDVHLDIRPVWYEDGHIWAHKQARLPLGVEDFLPVESGELRGVPVDIPHHSENFLEAYYGKGWKVPDPGYSNASQRVPALVKRKLDSVCITPADYQAMQQQIEQRRAEHPQAGKLIATGLHPLYPLSDYEANCEW